MSIVDEIRAQAGLRPDQPALVADSAGERRVVNYGELVAGFERSAANLRSAGLRSGDRCGLVAEQGTAFIEAALAILAADACLVPVADEHGGDALAGFAAAARLQQIVVVGAGRPRFESLPDAAAADGAGDRDFRALRPAYLRFTSGTTSQRKGVILGHAAVQARIAAANQVLGIGPRDRVMWLLPMAHHFVVSILLYLSRGATVLLPAGSLARNVLEFAAREGASVFYASPHHYRSLGKDTSGIGLASVRLAVSTAEGLGVDVAERFRDRFGLPLSQALGIIEVGIPVANLAAAADKPGALGRPLPGFDVWLRGEDGQPVTGPGSPDRSGEICIRGPGLFDAYLDPWLPAARVLEPDGFRTGDQGWFDADGDLHLVGRRASRICMAGMKFFGEEVEAVLDRHPAVRESRVFSREHAHLGEIPVAEIVPAASASPPTRSELAAHCRAALPGYKVPREFLIVTALARTLTGKVRRGDAAAASAASPQR